MFRTGTSGSKLCIFRTWTSSTISELRMTIIYFPTFLTFENNEKNIFTGHKEYGTENQNYKPLQAGATCTLSSPPLCTAVNISGLEWRIHGHHTYYISIKVTNTAGLVMIQTSSPYIHDVQPPAEGVVLDIDTQVSETSYLLHLYQSNQYSWAGYDPDI